jgi:copper resistance protein C
MTAAARHAGIAGRVAALAATAVLGMLVMMTAPAAAAHTSLKAASPAIGSVVAPPVRIELTYADPVRLPRVILTDQSGRRHEAGRAAAVDNMVTQQVTGTLTPGTYTVAWRVVAADGHPVTGSYSFTVANAAQPGSTAAGPADIPAAGSGAADSGVPAGRPASGAGWWWMGLALLVSAVLAGATALIRRRLSTVPAAGNRPRSPRRGPDG